MTFFSVQIRPLQAADHDAWLPLWLGYQDFYEVDIPAATTELTWRRLLDANEPMHGALAWEGGQAVGLAHWVFHRSCWTTSDDCYLQDLFVVARQRGSGVGRRLLDQVYLSAAAAGCTSVYWLTHESNLSAQRLYDRAATRSGFIHYCHVLNAQQQ